jgi:hypothetical protein
MQAVCRFFYIWPLMESKQSGTTSELYTNAVSTEDFFDHFFVCCLFSCSLYPQSHN